VPDEFFPHRSAELWARIAHIENHLANTSIRRPGVGGLSTVGSSIAIGTAGGGSAPSPVNPDDFLLVQPDGVDRNRAQPTDDAFHALVVQAHSASQTADWQQWREADDSVAAAVGPQAGYNFSASETALTVQRAGIFDVPVTSNANQALYVRMPQSAPGGSWICAFETSDAFGNLIAGVGLDLFTAGPDFYQPDSVSVSRIVADLAPAFADNTSAVWRGRVNIQARDFGGIRTGITIEGTGTAPAIGFLGAPAVVRPTSTTDLRQALIDLGLYTTGGATPLNLNGGTLTAGGVAAGLTTKTGPYTLLYTDQMVEVDAGGGPVTVTLPTAVGHSGQWFTIKKIDATVNAVTIATTGGQTIDGGATAVILMPQTALDLRSNNVNWDLV